MNLLLTGCASLPPAQRTETVRVEWDPVTTNADGTPIDDLAGYVVRVGQEQDRDVGLATEVTLLLRTGRHLLSVSAYDQSGNVSHRSNELEVNVR